MEKAQQLTPIIFGASGLLGGHLFEHFHAQDPNTIGTFGQNPKTGLVEFDLVDGNIETLNLQQDRGYVAIICASLTNIGYINANPQASFEINVSATERLIQSLTDRQIPVVFVSSDNVFPGRAGAYTDDNMEAPVSEYGVQKRALEARLMTITHGNCCIVRLAKIIGQAGKDGTILNDIVGQLQSGNEVKAASDLIFNPTAVQDIVFAIEHLIKGQYKGTYNFCNPQVFSRLDLTNMLAKSLHIDSASITDIKFSELDSSGKRPLNTTMINSSIFDGFDFTNVETCIQKGLSSWCK
ncbi:sugar nucleotide-binding protein [Pseudoalteromonas sp. Of7M-16]|uniref:sugar nucleotide-binding protein n=1 Tax=Pseudoalteromonas sp. Of7M-16 TaxID=2917756 RepID=UPI001EF42821|nr:sugar nucleotide-binding protein [Pseudoalteromonas sp. Of7M-16]MCG7549883.1 sugar nucleotide-binding protein [Pseudoalteromonas sp. Of7M-16]